MIKYDLVRGISTIGVLTALLVTSCTSITKSPEAEKSVSQLLGEMIIEFDASHLKLGDPNPFGSGPISTVYEENYKNYVVNLPQSERFSYFWAGLWHFEFQEGTMDLYVDVVKSDIASEIFIDELRKFVQRSNDSGRKGWRTTYTERTLHHLEQH